MEEYQVRHKDGHFVPSDMVKLHEVWLRLSDEFQGVSFFSSGIGLNAEKDPCYVLSIDSPTEIEGLVEKLPPDIDGVPIVYTFRKNDVRLLDKRNFE